MTFFAVTAGFADQGEALPAVRIIFKDPQVGTELSNLYSLPVVSLIPASPW